MEILSLTCSIAVALVKRRTAPLVAIYAASPGLPRRPAVDEMLTIDPPRDCRIAVSPTNPMYACGAVERVGLETSRQFCQPDAAGNEPPWKIYELSQKIRGY